MDTIGLVLAVVVHAANIQDRDGAKLLLNKIKGKCPRLKLIWADGAYAGQLIEWVKTVLVEKMHTVSPEDLNLFKIVDTEDEVVDVLDKFYKKYDLSPNF